jgi:hypothetical protein
MEGEEGFSPPPVDGPESHGPAATLPRQGFPDRGGRQIPRQGGWRFSGHLTISDVYWIILDALSHHIPGQGRPPGPSGGWAYSGLWRGVQGSPGGEGAERDSLDTQSQ